MERFPDEVWSLIRAFRPRQSPTAKCIARVPPELLRALASLCKEKGIGWNLRLVWDASLFLRVDPAGADNVRWTLRFHKLSRVVGRAFEHFSFVAPTTVVRHMPRTVRSLSELNVHVAP